MTETGGISSEVGIVSSPGGDADAIIRYVEQNSPNRTVIAVHNGDDPTALLRHDGHGVDAVVDLERWFPAPTRPAGNVDVHDAESFVAAVQSRCLLADDATGGTVRSFPHGSLYADEENMRLEFVLNDDGPALAAGWRDYRVRLALRPTPQWKAWVEGQGLDSDRERFALRIEDGQDEILEPPAAEMLELAQDFHASVSTKVRVGGRLASGARQFVLEETVSASAGEKRNLNVPETFRLGLRPFIGTDRFEVIARLRYRVNPSFAIGYVLVRPEEVERQAFLSVAAAVDARLPHVQCLNGTPPAPRVPRP